MQKPIQVVLAIDSFKGSATSAQAESWVKAGLLRAQADAKITQVPIADGGEGTVAALTTALHGTIITQSVSGPLGQLVSAQWGWLDPHAAVIETAQASGLHLTSGSLDDAMKASTYGVGQCVKAAIDRGAHTIYVGLGGSATTDGGVGMAEALGVRFYDAFDQPIAPGAKGLAALKRIDVSQRLPQLDEVSVILLSDVTNPLAGPNGAAMVYGAQKGLTATARRKVDRDLQHLGALMAKTVGRNIADQPGAGAAGGLGAGFLAFTQAQSRSGIDEILQLVGLDDALRQADLVITGEGRIDAQSLNGKAPLGVAHAAKRQQVPVVALVGARAADLGDVYALGIDAVMPISSGPQSLAEAMASVKPNLMAAGETALRIFLLKQ